MCTGAEIAGLAIAIGGTYMSQQSAEEAANKQQSIINQAADENSRLQTKKSDTITNFADTNYDPTTRDKNYEAAATKNEDSLKDALLSASGGEGQIYTGTEGNLSSDYSRAKAKSTADATQDILNRTKLLARSNAGSLLFNDESLKGANLASDVMGINSAADRNNNSARVGAGSVRNNGSTLGGLLLAGSGAIPSAIKNNTWGGV